MSPFDPKRYNLLSYFLLVAVVSISGIERINFGNDADFGDTGFGERNGHLNPETDVFPRGLYDRIDDEALRTVYHPE